MTRKSTQLSNLEFLLDENVSVKTLKRLRMKNLTVRSVRSENILGIKNGSLLSLCKERKWILITHDKDFLNPLLKEHYGIILVNIHPAIVRKLFSKKIKLSKQD